MTPTLDADALEAALNTPAILASPGAATFRYYIPHLLRAPFIEAYLAALPDAGAGEPAGWKLVPVEPTDEMWAAGMKNVNRKEIYTAMLAASPLPPSPDHSVRDAAFSFRSHLFRQREWSERTFGPGDHAKRVVDHIRKELREIEAQPTDLSEWMDVTILALDGAWRAGYSPDQIIAQLVGKQTKNEARAWPDWRTMPADKAIEHDRSVDAAALKTTPASPGWVEVKALEWRGEGRPRAWSIVGRYDVAHDADEPEEWSVSRDGSPFVFVASMESAKAAAQADYDQRIRSALTASGGAE